MSDRLMNSLISKYSLEGNTDGEPNGHFYLDRKAINAVSREVIGTHFGWTGEKRENYLKENVPKLWKYYDLLGEGFIDAAKGSPFLRSLLGEPEISNGLQLQVGEEGMETHKKHHHHSHRKP